jgi:Mg-chelatase subunit ChlD/uncharacterized membrane protein
VNPATTQFVLENPAWLAAFGLLPLLWFFLRRSLVHGTARQHAASLAVRCVLLTLLILALTGPTLRRTVSRVFLVVAYDTSRSIGQEAQEQAAAFRQELAGQAGDTIVREFAFPEAPDRGPTDLAAAILTARSLVPADRVPRIVLLSDGNPAAGDALAAAAAAGCEIDVLPLPALQHEVYLSAVEAPAGVRDGEAYFVDVVVHSLHEDSGRLTLRVDDSLFEEREVTLVPGENRFRFRNILAETGTEEWQRLTARIDGCRDRLSENNTAQDLVIVGARPRILIVDPQPELAGPLREALLANELFQVEARPLVELPDRLDTLKEYDLIILSNVPATDISESQVTALEHYVHDDGGGLIVVGGNRAFTAGDYGGTRLEHLLPVEAYVKPDKPKPSLAMLLVLDRSGSMKGAPIELARQAARQAVARLGPDDQVGILAFEDRMHWVVLLQPFSDGKHVMDRIDTIVAGGGTNIFPALDQAYLALREAESDLKHIILLSDGVSHPGDFNALAQQIAEDGITVSTVGVGDEASEEFLRKIASLAAGHAYFCTDPADVPRIFELDVMAAGKHGITEQPFRPATVRPARMLAGFDPSSAPPLLGYVDTRAKAGSQLLLRSPAGDPLLAWWRYGRGVSMAFTSDVHSRWSAAWHRWPGFGDFWTRLARQAMRAEASDRSSVTVTARGARAVATLDALDAGGRWLSLPYVAAFVQQPDGRYDEIACELVAPGRYVAEVPTEAAGDYRVDFLAPQFDGSTPVAQRAFAVGYCDELHVLPTNTELLRQIADRTGGRYAATPADALRPAESSVPRTVRLWPWLICAAVVLFVLDVALKRVTPGQSYRQDGSRSRGPLVGP